MQTKVVEAATNRLTAQQQQGHFKQKLEEEKKTVEGLEATADTLQQEFTVRLSVSLVLCH